MTTLIRIAVSLTFFFLFLCITIKDKPIFVHAYNLISPATIYVQTETENFFKKSMSSTQNYSKKLFDNSIPKVKDSVGSKLSGTKKAVQEPAERITAEEKAELDALIKNH